MEGDFILASQSPRRKELLKKISGNFVVAHSGYEEPNGFSVYEYVIANAKCKATTAWADLQQEIKALTEGVIANYGINNQLNLGYDDELDFDVANIRIPFDVIKAGKTVLASDTVVFIDGIILNKPKSVDEARRMLKLLSGRTHRVITGVCFCTLKGFYADCDESLVEFEKFSKEEIDEYIKSGSPFDKAGGYGIQDEFIMGKIKRISGSLDNIIGLPTELIQRMIKLYQIKIS